MKREKEKKKKSYERQKEQNKIYFIFKKPARLLLREGWAKSTSYFTAFMQNHPDLYQRLKLLLIRYLPCPVFLRNTNNPSVIIPFALERKYKWKVIEYSKFIHFKVGTISND